LINWRRLNVVLRISFPNFFSLFDISIPFRFVPFSARTHLTEPVHGVNPVLPRSDLDKPRR
jgi:hypothetical protein